MSADSQSFDPYRSPIQPEVPYTGPPPTGRTGWLTTLCVLCIVLGALGLFNSLIGAVGAIGGQFIQKALQPTAGAGMPAEMKDAQEKFQAEINAVQMKYFWVTVPALAFRFVAALLLLIGGIRTLSLVEPGRKLLLIACSVAIVFELLHAILQSIISLDTMTVVNEYVVNLTETMPQNANGPDMSRILPTIIRASVIGGLVFAYLISLVKIGLYIFGLIYLRKPHIIALFHSNQPTLTSDF